MVFKDLFSLSDEEYAKRISEYPDEKLKVQEMRKMRQKNSATFGLGLAVPNFLLTGPGALISVGVNCRRRAVAKRKNVIIERELIERDLPLRGKHKSDVAIPVAVSYTHLTLPTKRIV